MFDVNKRNVKLIEPTLGIICACFNRLAVPVATLRDDAEAMHLTKRSTDDDDSHQPNESTSTMTKSSMTKTGGTLRSDLTGPSGWRDIESDPSRDHTA